MLKFHLCKQKKGCLPFKFFPLGSFKNNVTWYFISQKSSNHYIHRINCFKRYENRNQLGYYWLRGCYGN